MNLSRFFVRIAFVLALQDMLPTIMSQMGMSTVDPGLASEFARRKGGENETGDGQAGTTNEQEGDDEVPSMCVD